MEAIAAAMDRTDSRQVMPASPQRRAGLLLMDNPIRDYDWGSTSTLAALQGREPTGRPEAELWMGAHPASPSMLLDGDRRTTLDEAVAGDPQALLGIDSAARFADRLPFLLKVLAVERALSIQVHPDAVQAARGFAREEAAGVPLGERSYVDACAKPELLCALEPMTALAGARPAEEAGALIALPGAPLLEPVAGALATGGVAAAVATLARWPVPARAELTDDVARACAARLVAAPELDHAAAAALRWVLRLHDQHPGDPFLVAPLLLRLISLAPLETLYVPAGVPHAYLIGTGVEVMATSDNVVRAGLTGKRVDVEELLVLLDVTAQPAGVPAETLAPGQIAWRPPVPAFQLGYVELDETDGEVQLASMGVPGPSIILCAAGSVELAVAGERLVLPAGRSAFASAGTGRICVRGTGRLFRATPGLG